MHIDIGIQFCHAPDTVAIDYNLSSQVAANYVCTSPRLLVAVRFGLALRVNELFVKKVDRYFEDLVF